MFRSLRDALGDVADLDVSAQTVLVNDRLSACLRACGLGTVVVVDPGHVVINVRGTLVDTPMAAMAGVTAGQGTLRVDMRSLVIDGDGYEQLAEILKHYAMDGDGAYVWLVPDGYLAGLSAVEQIWASEGGGYFAHESICVLNTGGRATRCRLDVFYENLEHDDVSSCFDVGSRRSVHYRLDKLVDANGNPLITKDAPVGYRITSLDTRVVVQGSRILTSGRGSEFASFGTAIAWAPQE